MFDAPRRASADRFILSSYTARIDATNAKVGADYRPIRRELAAYDQGLKQRPGPDGPMGARDLSKAVAARRAL
jgi:hypothetical protein